MPVEWWRLRLRSQQGQDDRVRDGLLDAHNNSGKRRHTYRSNCTGTSSTVKGSRHRGLFTVVWARETDAQSLQLAELVHIITISEDLLRLIEQDRSYTHYNQSMIESYYCSRVFYIPSPRHPGEMYNTFLLNNYNCQPFKKFVSVVHTFVSFRSVYACCVWWCI